MLSVSQLRYAITPTQLLYRSISKHVGSHCAIQQNIWFLDFFVKTNLSIKSIDWEMKSSVLFWPWSFFSKGLNYGFFKDNLIDSAIWWDFKPSNMLNLLRQGCIIKCLLLTVFGAIIHQRYGGVHYILILKLTFFVWWNLIMMSVVKFREQLLKAYFLLLEKIFHSSGRM